MRSKSLSISTDITRLKAEVRKILISILVLVPLLLASNGWLIMTWFNLLAAPLFNLSWLMGFGQGISIYIALMLITSMVDSPEIMSKLELFQLHFDFQEEQNLFDWTKQRITRIVSKFIFFIGVVYVLHMVLI